MWDSYWPYWEFSAETEGGLCLRGINLFPYMGTEKKEDYPCQYFKFAVTRDWMSRGNRKEIESLSLLGHWLKSCLFQQWPKLITIQACCSVTNSMWKELVASEAGAHCRQPQQKDQGFGWTWNTNFSSALGFGPCPSHVPGAPVPKPPLGLPGSTLDAAHHLAPARPPRDHGGDLRCHHLALLSPARARWDGGLPPRSLPTTLTSQLASPRTAAWQGLQWGNAGKGALVLLSPHPSVPQERVGFYPGCSPTTGQKNGPLGGEPL